MSAVDGLQEMVIPDLVEPITGYRAWRLVALRDERGQVQLRLMGLHARHAQALWSPAAPPAQACQAANCPAVGREIGAREVLLSFSQHDCKCGYHAWKAPAENGSYMDEAKLKEQDLAILGGTAHLWGTICEHERGWRAERALPASIDEIRWGPNLLRRIQLQEELLVELQRQYPKVRINIEPSMEKETVWARGKRWLKRCSRIPFVGSAAGAGIVFGGGLLFGFSVGASTFISVSSFAISAGWSLSQHSASPRSRQRS